MIRSKADFSLDRGNLIRRGSKGIIYARWQFRRKRYLRSTQRHDEAGAKLVAWSMYQSVRDEETLPQVRRSTATVADVLEIYTQHYQDMEKPLKKSSVTAAAGALRSFCRTVWPGRKFESINVYDINRQAVLDFRRIRRERDGIDGEDTVHNYRLNRVVGKMRAVFGRQARQLYQDHGIDLEPLDISITALREPRRNPQPVTSQQVWRAHLGVCRQWLHADPRRVVVFEIMRYAGLRDSEVLALRRHWIQLDDPIGQIAIITRSALTDPGKSTWTPKNGKDRFVPVRARLLRRWLDLLPSDDPHDYLIPAEYRSQEADWFRELSKFVGSYWPEKRKTLYELRRFAGSEHLQRFRDVPGTAAFLGDTVEVTYKHYASLLKQSSTNAL